jgi:hypothetical protein
MNSTSDISTDVESAERMRLAQPGRRFPAVRSAVRTGTMIVLAVGAVLTLRPVDSCRATERPPREPEQTRAWLVGHLVTDMEALGTFGGTEFAKVPGIVNALTDDQVSLLARFYYLTREKTEQDARLYAVQLSDTEEALARAKAQVADLLTQEHNRIEQTYSELATVNPGCETLCQVVYASVPGWCAYNRYAVPDWYYGNGCYVGPVFSAGYCGTYAAPVYNTFHDRSSRYNYWNSRTYVHNNITGIARTHGGSLAAGTRHPHSKTGFAAAPSLKYHAQAAGLTHTLHPAAKHDAAPSMKQMTANHSRPVTAKHAPQPKSVAHSQPHAQRNHVVHTQSRHQQPKQTVHAQPQHVAHAQPQHVAHTQAHVQTVHARHS